MSNIGEVDLSNCGAAIFGCKCSDWILCWAVDGFPFLFEFLCGTTGHMSVQSSTVRKWSVMPTTKGRLDVRKTVPNALVALQLHVNMFLNRTCN